MTMPRVSVGFPVYNGERFMRIALDSLLTQTHDSFEIILSDNGSTDSTRAICEEYAKRDLRVRVLRSDENRGAAWNFNRVVEEARGEFFMWAAHDDVWLPECLALYESALRSDTEAVLVYCHAQPIDSKGRPVGAPYSKFANDGTTSRDRFARMLAQWELHAAIYGMYRTKSMRRTRLIQTHLSCEIIFLAEIALQGKTIEIADVCSLKRVPDEGESYRTSTEQYVYLDPRLEKKRVPFSFRRLRVTYESVKGLLHTRPPMVEGVDLAFTAARVYVDRMMLVDAKEAVIWEFAERNPLFVQTLRSVYRAVFR